MKTVRDEQTGDVAVVSAEAFTASMLIEALKEVPPDAVVLRYADWPIDMVRYQATDANVVELI